MRRLLTRTSFPPSTVRRTITLLTAAAVVVVGLGAGAAYAYWTAPGTGSGVATTGAPSQVHVIAVASGNDAATTLVPGGSADLVLEFNNPNSYQVTIVGIAQNGSVSPSGGNGPGTACSGSPDNTGVGVTTSALNVPVAAGNNVVVHIDVANAGVNGATMSTSSVSGCQGATFQIPVTVTLHR